jgi:hydroxymethylpyrimidine pyrophosphatase-like HAD family hydrolase
MPLNEEHLAQLHHFYANSRFHERGAVITDLDGTAIHEFQGVYSIPKEVEFGLKKIYDLGRPIVINTLRFPLSVIRTFGKEWYRISNCPIATVLLNGSQLGYISEGPEGLRYEEISAFPLEEREIDVVLSLVANFLRDGIKELLVFFYPRNWKKGEIIWTPVEGKISFVQNKYPSAALVISEDIKSLEARMKSEDICMIFLLIDIPQDKLMAYQHTQKNNFFTHTGVDKRFGAVQIAKLLDFDLDHSVGAGDSQMDTFLAVVSQPVYVGNHTLPFHDHHPAIKVSGSTELGHLLFELANLEKTSKH